LKNTIKIVVICIIAVVSIAGIILVVNNLGPNRDFKQDMRDFVQDISAYAKAIDPTFLIIPQNGQELLTANGTENGIPDANYTAAIDGVGREDLFYGYTNDDIATPISELNYMMAFLDIAESNGVEVLVTDYCWTPSKMNDSYIQNALKGYISFAADHRELDNIPTYPTPLYNMSALDITNLSAAQNFLYLINPSSFPNKTAFLDAVRATNYDLVLIDLFYEDEQLNQTEITSLKVKANGGARLVIAYMSIGEAEDYRYYWQSAWSTNPPSWVEEENPDWPGNYKVRYWDPNWQSIIFGNNDSYVKKILDVGFNGVYLDIIDAFEYFE
jgi:cysteinyl-tRNA synthetase